MVREIKFRAWDTEKEIWIDIEDDCFKMNPLTGNIMTDEDNSCSDPECCGGPFPMWHDNDRFKVQQYTGLKDKNGKEIYEGDIVIGAGGRNGGPSEVFFDYGQWQPFSFLGTYAGEEFEIIGNVHEDPELLPRPSKRQEAKG